MLGHAPPVTQGGNAAGEFRAGAFASIFEQAVAQVENYRSAAEAVTGKFLSGEDEEIHKVAMATQQAELSFEVFLQVKNKVVQAYQEIMRMQL